MAGTARVLVVNVLASTASLTTGWAQAGLHDDRVMIQGFYWESHRHGRNQNWGPKLWYQIVREQSAALREGRFDLIWLPPPSFARNNSAGYNPSEYYKLDNDYGDRALQRAMLEQLLRDGIEPVADIVINHRRGSTRCADFRNPNWGTETITADDEVFNKPGCETFKANQRGAPEEPVGEYAPARGRAYNYPAFPDIDHTNAGVRSDVIRYLLQLKSMGYRGWRFDMVHGFHARWIGAYNRASKPTFCVGEYDWGAHAEQRGWIWHSATAPGQFATSCSVFDFSTFFSLRDNKGNQPGLYGSGSGIGMVADHTDGLAWKNKAVTFLENHDTGYRTNDDGSAQPNHQFDSFSNNWEVEQGYAQILTHPGLPTVFWKHYFDWGSDLRNKIRALINARKVAGVDAGSTVFVQDNARSAGVYAARIIGTKGDLYVRIGGEDAKWEPRNSGFLDYREYAQGAGWKVWVGLPGNPEVQTAPAKTALPVPELRDISASRR